MIRIGSFIAPSRVFLAPIAGYTDWPYRLVVRAAGHRGLAYTELLNPRGLLRGTESSLNIARTSAEDRPLGVQLYGNDPEWFCAAARWAEEQGFELIDINMGCPVDKVTKTNGGSMLLCDSDRTIRMAERIVNAVSIPVTAKLRLGWGRDDLTAPALARALESVGIRLITIHGRTTWLRFKGTVDLDGIAAVVAAVASIPVLGNGDIRTPEDAARMIAHTGCDGVMVARAAIKRPWLPGRIDRFLETGEIPPEPTILEKCRLIRLHFEKMIEFRDETHAMRIMRARIANYGASMGHIKPIKERIRLMESPADLHAALDELESKADPSWTSVPVGPFTGVPPWRRSEVPATGAA